MGRRHCLDIASANVFESHFCTSLHAESPVSSLQSQTLKVKSGVYLWELALFINEGDDVHRLECDDFQSLAVISEVNVIPGNVLCKVFLLLQLEDMVHKKLLKVLIGNVDAELLKAGRGQDGYPWSSVASAALLYGILLFPVLHTCADTLLLYSTV